MKIEKTILLILFTFLFIACNPKQKKIKNDLIGAWSKIDSNLNSPPSPPGIPPFGIRFSKDTVEYLNGFLRYDLDSISKKRKLNFKGIYSDYKINNDSIFILNPFDKVWEFKWEISKVKKDTLILTKDRTDFMQLKKVELVENNDFDQIILSKTGCYGSCSIIDISLNKKGEFYFYGESYVDPLGVYKSQIDSVTVNKVFSKFAHAYNSLLNENSSNKIKKTHNNSLIKSNHTDDSSFITTLFKDGKIIKTIENHNSSITKELIWAYTPLQYLYTQTELKSVSIKTQNQPVINYFRLKKNDEMVILDKSEYFYLWLELQKSKVVETEFNSTYYTEPILPSKAKNLVMIESDGRFFKFIFEDKNPITFDLGYNL
ncbi:DUF6438 domain-containing protein [Aureivirga sp. CE67]|uniref:DUF6438 domain-containing protein n=1 Tax=Aureivirga sp. CE67 TaxID=1788983 RepID=UPI0018CA8A92|nr:DUF6438 domain-containing protein [Aureivirga sp. CE67]